MAHLKEEYFEILYIYHKFYIAAIYVVEIAQNYFYVIANFPKSFLFYPVELEDKPYL